METIIEKPIYQVAEIVLSYKSNVKPSLRPKISSSKEGYEVLLENWDSSRIEFVEQFKVMLLNRANKVLGICEISTDGVTGTVAEPKIIFAAAIRANPNNFRT